MATNFVLTIPPINPLLSPPNVPLTLHMSSNIVPPYQPPTFQIASFFNNNDATPFYPYKTPHDSPNLT